jgi:hypothetical protein
VNVNAMHTEGNETHRVHLPLPTRSAAVYASSPATQRDEPKTQTRSPSPSLTTAMMPSLPSSCATSAVTPTAASISADSIASSSPASASLLGACKV